jgi:hypothetical protein
MRRRSRAALVIFARHPSEPAKSRLVPPLSRAQAQSLHVALLESTVRLAVSVPRVDAWLFLTRAGPARLRLPARLRRDVQRGRGLGARLGRAFAQLFRAGYQFGVVIGSDSPTLPPRLLLRAFAGLRRAQVVLGPARDAGFYLIGLRRETEDLASIFRGVPWGTPRALGAVRRNLRCAGAKTLLLPPWHDVDTPSDMQRLRHELEQNRARSLAPLRRWFAVRR